MWYCTITTDTGKSRLGQMFQHNAVTANSNFCEQSGVRGMLQSPDDSSSDEIPEKSSEFSISITPSYQAVGKRGCFLHAAIIVLSSYSEFQDIWINRKLTDHFTIKIY